MTRPPRWPRVFHNQNGGIVRYVVVFEKFYVQWQAPDEHDKTPPMDIVVRSPAVDRALEAWEHNDQVDEFVLVRP